MGAKAVARKRQAVLLADLFEQQARAALEKHQVMEDFSKKAMTTVATAATKSATVTAATAATVVAAAQLT